LSTLAHVHRSPAAEGDAGAWPRISLITPVWNSAKYIEETIASVLAQEYPNLEYWIVDGASTDGTVETIRKYEKQITGWISEPDKGMYDALNKGFARTSGEVMGWISATDKLHPGGLKVVGEVFRTFPQVEWITGRPTHFNENGLTINVDGVPRWTRLAFLAGFNRYLQQESTYWRRSLWQRAGGYVDASRRNASDFELWVRFFRHARVYPVDALIGGFRMHGASMALQDLEACHRIHQEILAAELKLAPERRFLRLFRAVNAGMKKIPGVRYAWWKLAELPMARWMRREAAPLIKYDVDKGWVCGAQA
jgi:glycosyltransferase involved in cell wall biosynthesis